MIKKSLPFLIVTLLFTLATPAFSADPGKADSPEAKTGPKDSPEGKKSGPADPNSNTNTKANDKDAKVFATYDKDNNGTVNDEEIQGMREGELSSSQRREIRKQVKEYDEDKDGELNLAEFLAWRKGDKKES